MKKLSLLLLIITVSVCSFGQGLDSLYMAYKNAKSVERRQLGNNIVQWLDEQNFLIDSTLLDKKLPEAEFERRILNQTVRYLLRFEHYALAYEAAQTLLHLSELANDTANLIISYYFMGFSCQRMGKMDESLVHAKECYELCLAVNDEEMLSSVVNNIANIYQINHQDSIAVIYFQKTIEIERKLSRMQNLAIRLGNIATSYLRLGKLNEALSSVIEGLEIDRKEGRPDRIAIRLHQMGEVYIAMENYVKAKEYELEALEYFEKAGRQYGQSIALNSLGEIEIYNGNINNAEKYFLKALSFAEEIQNNLLVQKIGTNLYELYRRDDNYKQSLFYFERSVAIKDSLFHIENQQLLSEFQVKYETAEKELEIERQQTEINRQNTQKTILFGSLLIFVLLVVLLIYIVVLRTRRNRELADANATKDKFFTIISHDLKNPALAQRDALQLLLDNSGNWDAASLSNYYKKLLKSANGQVDLLYTLLGWAQLQTGRMPFQPAKFDLTVILQPGIALIRNMTEGKGLVFDVRMPETVLVTCDKNMLTTVVRNLLTNAVKFTAKGGSVSLDISPCNGSNGACPVVTYVVSISDTGIGMTVEQIQNLFRIDRHHSRRGTAGEQGSGLGLIVCRELLQKHGSELHVESKEGKGSRFWFEIGV